MPESESSQVARRSWHEVLLGVLLALLAVVGLVAELGGNPGPGGRLPRGPIGDAGFSEGSSILGDRDADLARELDGIAATGATWLRVDVRWPDVERSHGAFRWGAVDRVVDAAAERGLRVLGILDFTPAWARPAGTTEKHPPSNPRDFAVFATAAATHYRHRGVRAWEIWNEPNSPQFWSPRADPAGYVRLLGPAYAAIKAVDHSATVLTGGTAPAVTGKGWLSPVDFLRGIYAHGGHGRFDAVAHHPYHWPYLPLETHGSWPTNAFGGVTPHLRAVMVAHGDRTKRIWGTETGAPVPATKNGITTTPQYLAQDASAAYAAWRAWPWTGPLLWYAYRDRGTDTGSPEDVFGLVTRRFGPKEPALDAFIRAIHRR